MAIAEVFSERPAVVSGHLLCMAIAEVFSERRCILFVGMADVAVGAFSLSQKIPQRSLWL